jgi:hypothetical protein
MTDMIDRVVQTARLTGDQPAPRFRIALSALIGREARRALKGLPALLHERQDL